MNILTDVLGEGKHRQIEHDVGSSDAEHGPRDLSSDVTRHLSPRESALGGNGERHGRVELCARNRPEGEDQRDEDRARCERVRKERNRQVSTGEPLTHDPGADDGREQKAGPDALRDHTAPEGRRRRVPRRAHDRLATRREGSGGARAARIASSRAGAMR